MDANPETLQGERTEKAQKGLAEGSISIQLTEPGHSWVVQNGDHEPYRVVFQDSVWTCTCMDFSARGKYGIRCKHIEAVRLSQNTSKQINTHKEEPRMEENGNTNGWVKLYHPAAGGVQCTLPLPTVALTKEQAKGMFDSLNVLLQVGFIAQPEGLEEGETKEAVTHLAHRNKANTDGTSTSIIDVYCGGNFKVVGVYLNNEDDNQKFTEAFGLSPDSIPVFDGDASIERQKNTARDKKYIVPVSGINVVYKANPKWEGDDDKKHSKRAFVRWERKVSTNIEAVTPAPATETATQIPPPPPVATPSVRLYQDGKQVSQNENEIQAFDKYVNKHGAVPQSLQALRESWAA